MIFYIIRLTFNEDPTITVTVALSFSRMGLHAC